MRWTNQFELKARLKMDAHCSSCNGFLLRDVEVQSSGGFTDGTVVSLTVLSVPEWIDRWMVIADNRCMFEPLTLEHAKIEGIWDVNQPYGIARLVVRLYAKPAPEYREAEFHLLVKTFTNGMGR